MSSFKRRLCQIIEKIILKKAQRVISVTEPISEIFYSKINKNRGKFIVITNGYDGDIINCLLQPKKISGDQFIITYTGSITLTKEIDEFFISVKKLLEQKEIEKDKFRINLIGNFKNYHLDEKLGIADLVYKYEGYLPNMETLKIQSNSTLLLLIVKTDRAKYAYSGKIFEYMAIGKPVLAIVPSDSIVAGVILKSGTGKIADPENIEEISQAILYYYDLWKKSELKVNPDYDFIKQFDRKKLTSDLASLMDSLV